MVGSLIILSLLHMLWTAFFCEQFGEEGEEEEDGDHQEESSDGRQQNVEEEAVVVDADSTDGAVLVNGNESEEQWGKINEGTASAL